MKPSWIISLSAAALVLVSFSLSVLGGASAAFADKSGDRPQVEDS